MTHPDDATLQTRFDDALPESARAAVDAHLAQCAPCSAKLVGLRALHTSFERWSAAAPGAGVDLTDAIFAKINESVGASNVVPIGAARERRAFSARRVLWPAVAVAVAAGVALLFSTLSADRGGAPPSIAQNGPVEAPPAITASLGGAEVTRIDVQGAQSYTVLEVAGASPDASTAVVWIQDSVEGEASLAAGH